ncbi:MAG: hypothetical protein ACE5EL_01510, partial [Anaerolineae bacterium]
VDIERMSEGEFANTRRYDSCVGDLAAMRPLTERIVAEATEPRYGTELIELYRRLRRLRATWQTDQGIVIPNQYTEVQVPRGQMYLLTSNWRSPVSRLHFYGCLQTTPPPFPRGVPGLNHDDIAAAAAGWSPPAPLNIIPPANQRNPSQPVPPPFIPPGEPPIYAPYFDARLGGPDPRVKIFYDPAETTDIYVNLRPRGGGGAPTPTPAPTSTPGGPTATPGSGPTATATATSGGGATATATVTATATATRAGVPTATPGGGIGAPINLRCSRIEPFRLRIDWIDNSTFETEFLIEVRVVGSGVGFAPVTSVPSATTPGIGTPYSYTSPLLAAGTTYEWRVQARNPGTGQVSPYSNTTQCTTASATDKVGCIRGKVYLQGRSDHSGTLIRINGFPMTATSSNGGFEVCGMPSGNHTVETAGACYLTAKADNVYLAPGSTVRLPYASLRGGDVNNDNTIDLFDLVRVGADYRSSPPGDPEADCTLDNRVDLFDLVLVGSNYGVSGPVPWGGSPPGRARMSLAAGGARLERHGTVGSPLALESRTLDDGEIAVDVIVKDAPAVWGAEVALAFDPEIIQVVDAQERPGIQIEPGAPWNAGGTAWVAVNEADNTAGTIEFVASRLKPAAPLTGDLVLATIPVRSASGTADDALWLTDVVLADVKARLIDVVWTGLTITPRPAFRLYVPAVRNGPLAPEGTMLERPLTPRFRE